MRPYAERPGRLSLQVLADLLALGWLATLLCLGDAARGLLLRLQVPASGLTDAGNSIGEAFASAAGTATRVPFVGDELAAALDGGRAAGASLAAVGQRQFETIATLATGTAALIVLLGVLPLLLGWLPLRLRYARAAGAAVSCRDGGTDLLALRALTGLPMRRLRAVSDNPASGWRESDPAVLSGLAALELRRLGLRAPR
ncbi:MAG: hypothetical protein ACT4O0_20085 [Pseudonocardia sp.]